MFYTPFDCYHLNPAETRTLSVLPDPGRPLSRVLLEKLTAAKIAKKFPAFYGTKGLTHYRVHKNTSMETV
jgi:hypothetical protein